MRACCTLDYTEWFKRLHVGMVRSLDRGCQLRSNPRVDSKRDVNIAKVTGGYYAFVTNLRPLEGTILGLLLKSTIHPSHLRDCCYRLGKTFILGDFI
ncbi:hypothetical protein AVEN_93148-1 [Araneus ventricosus]|uniref:Uncharacterized protein n=1 Tax=Araneus ventricosus TaxID=182803 RepID=A0A4Y2MST5_ARAVE|nr:hypothetical protein AVEN_229487-1 [Araneus ventricosus]GBN29652.1 hypothetical protein AVEN_93148-1 [Araneus ventricosus]